MLQAIRDRISGVMAIIVLGLLAIPFAFFGVGNFFQPQLPNTVAKVGGTEITRVQFQSSFNTFRNRMRQLLGPGFDEAQYSTPLVRREHLESMIDRQLLQRYAVANGMDIPHQQLAERIQSIGAFQVAGSFDTQIYRQALSLQGLSPAEFEGQVRSDMATQNLIDALAESGRPTPDEYETVLALENQTRRIDFVTIEAAPFRDAITVTDEQIEQYYNDNTQQFMRPEQVSIDYVDLQGQDRFAGAEPDEQQLRDLYASQKRRFMTEERRRAAHILLTLEDDAGADEAQNVRQRLEELRQRIVEGGEDFGAIAEEYSEDIGSAESGGDLGWIEPGDMVSAFEDALYRLQEGEVSEPVRTGFGWHLIKLLEIDPSVGQTFEQARSQLAEEWREDMIDRQYRNLADEMVNLSFEHPDSLEPIAESLGLEIQTSELFTRDSGSGIAAEPEIRAAAFSDLVLQDNMNSDPVELGEHRMVVLRVHEHIPAAARPLDEVREEIALILQRRQASDKAREAAEALADQARAAGSLKAAIEAVQSGEKQQDSPDSADDQTAADDAAGDSGAGGDALVAGVLDNLQVTSMESVTRRDFQLGQIFLEAVFTLGKTPEPDTSRIAAVPRNGQDWAVVELHEVRNAAAPASDQQRERLRAQLQRSLASQELEALVAELRAQTDIEVFEDQL